MAMKLPTKLRPTVKVAIAVPDKGSHSEPDGDENCVWLPKGYEAKVSPGDDFEAVCKMTLNDDGTASILTVDGMPVGEPQEKDEEEGEDPQQPDPDDLDQNGQSYSQAVRAGSGM